MVYSSECFTRMGPHSSSTVDFVAVTVVMFSLQFVSSTKLWLVELSGPCFDMVSNVPSSSAAVFSVEDSVSLQSELPPTVVLSAASETFFDLSFASNISVTISFDSFVYVSEP